jgi:hypothetical protein
MSNYINIGLPQAEWVIVKNSTGKLEDLGYVTLQEQLATTKERQVAPISMNRVLISKEGAVLHTFLWGEREYGPEGGFTGRILTSERVFYIGEAAYQLAKKARKLSEF